MNLPKLIIGNDLEIEHPIIQGGMGIGVSNYNLAGHVAKEGGLGIVSSAAVDRLVSKRYGKRIRAREAAAIEVEDAKKIAGANKSVGINIMVAIQRQYEDSVLGAMDGGADVIISGAGLPLRLPEIAQKHERYEKVKLIPIVSSGRALDLICRRWQRNNKLPDAIVVEGPLAGGHIAWRSLEEANAEKNTLENLVAEVLEASKKYGNIPVIAAGGVYTHDDIKKYLDMGCAGVQMGTRFLATQESGASQAYKDRLLTCTEDDIVLADRPGSPCSMLFRVIKDCPFYAESVNQEREVKCSKGYVLINGQCPAKDDKSVAFCICNGLLASAEANEDSIEKELYTVGANAHKLDSILTVKELIQELVQG